MPHPVTRLEIIEALESNAQSIAEYFSGLSDRVVFAGDPEHWGPAHHLVHLTRSSAAVERSLRSAAPPPHSNPSQVRFSP